MPPPAQEKPLQEKAAGNADRGAKAAAKPEEDKQPERLPERAQSEN